MIQPMAYFIKKVGSTQTAAPLSKSDKAPPRPHATAYRYGAGVVENARRHVGRPELLKLDILHFFDSIRYIQVKEAAFPAEIYAEPQEQCLRRLLGQVDFWLQAQPDSQEAAEYRRWLLDEMRDGR